MANTSIASFTEVLVALGLADLSTITPGDEALAQMAHGHAEGACKQILKYNPVLGTRTFYLPTREEIAGSMLHEYDEFDYATVTPLNNSTKAELRGHTVNQIEGDKLFAPYIPIRSIGSVYEDVTGRAGQGVNKFPASSLLTVDSDYWVDFDEDGICKSGLIYRTGVWSTEPRSIKITATTGYSPSEFAGFGDVDASPIKQAVLITAVAFFKNLKLQAANASGGFAAGNLKREKLDQYEYELGNVPDSANLASFGFDPGAPPDIVLQLLSPFELMHYTMI